VSNDTKLPLQVQALLNRLQARLGSGVADVAATLLAAAEQAPDKLSQEWQLFWQEVELEAQRLEQGDDDSAVAEPTPAPAGDPQLLIDHLRARVAALSHKLDA